MHNAPADMPGTPDDGSLPNGIPFCQSCGMPMKKDPENGGTNADGTKSPDYPQSREHAHETGCPSYRPPLTG